MSHNHNHSHTNSNEFNQKFKIGIVLNLVFIAVEVIYGLLYNSLALIADAGHNLSDVLGLVIAWGANYLLRKEPTKTFTYGFKRTTILAAVLNSLILFVALGIILMEAIQRFNSETEVEGNVIIIVAGVGVLINGLTTYLFVKDKEKDLNIKGAYLHMLSDTLISVGVVISGIIIYYTNLYWIDSVISIIIVFVIFWGTWQLFRDSTILSMDGVPSNIKYEEVKNYILGISEIEKIHHLHIWALSTSETALTIHVIPNENEDTDLIIKKINEGIKKKFNITHTTIQIEKNTCESG